MYIYVYIMYNIYIIHTIYISIANIHSNFQFPLGHFSSMKVKAESLTSTWAVLSGYRGLKRFKPLDVQAPSCNGSLVKVAAMLDETYG